jgi:hypothetical protein
MSSAAKRGPGRPPTGNSEQVWGRISATASELIDARAEELGIPKARVVGALLDFALAHESEVAYPQSAARRRDQQELPLNKAS